MASHMLKSVALVTGAAGGIGQAAALSFAEAGILSLVFADVDFEKAKEAAEKSKQYATNKQYGTLAVGVDVTNESSVQAMVNAAVAEFGRLDYCVNSAGTGVLTHNSIIDASIEEFDKLNAINSRGMMLCVREESKAMAKQEPIMTKGRSGQRSLGRGSIVNIGSGNSYIAIPGFLPYTTSKHAMMGITKTAALDNVPHGIRVNAVCPSWVDTPMMQKEFEKIPELEGMVKKIAPAGRMAMPEEIGETIAFLCSPSASYINGIGLVVDSGTTLSVHME